MKKKDELKDLKFEDAIAQLEEAVLKIERGDLPLEEAIETYEKGIKLSRICHEKLKSASAVVEKLVVTDEGGEDEAYQTELFAADDGDEE